MRRSAYGYAVQWEERRLRRGGAKISARKANLFLLQQLCNAPPFFNNISYCHILK